MTHRHDEHDHYGARRPDPSAQLAGTMFDTTPAEPEPPVRRVPVRAHMRTVEGPPAPSGEERKAAALEQHELDALKRRAIVYVRAKLLELYRSRVAWDPNPGVSADDAAKILDAWPDFPTELRAISGNWKGAIFAGKGWERTGRVVKSKRDHMNGTDLPVWRPAGV
jgi:hypothetical protein